MRTLCAVAFSLMSSSAFAQDLYNVVCELTDGSRRPLGECQLSNWPTITEVYNTRANATYQLDMSQCRMDVRNKSSDYVIVLRYVQGENNADIISARAYVTTGQRTNHVVTETKEHVFKSENGIFYLRRNMFTIDKIDGKDVVLACGDSNPIDLKVKRIRF